MYQVRKNNRVVKRVLFPTYEQARQFLRKHIRKLVAQGKMLKSDFSSGHWAVWDSISRNPTNYTRVGFSIRKVA